MTSGFSVRAGRRASSPWSASMISKLPEGGQVPLIR